MSAPFTPDLDAYFARIGLTRPEAPTVAALRAVTKHHAFAIPFENLDICLGRSINLGAAQVEEKLVRQRRGGYCFEQNGYFAHVLRALGFEVTLLTARVRWLVPPEVITPTTHGALLVPCEGRRWLVDVGFGSVSSTAPLDLDSDAEQPTSHETRRIRRNGAHYINQARFAGEWMDTYHFTLEERYPVDFELANWWTSAHPASRFVQNLIASRPADGVRYNLQNDEFIIRPMNGREPEKRSLKTHDELIEVLARYYDMHFPPDTRFTIGGKPWPGK